MYEENKEDVNQEIQPDVNQQVNNQTKKIDLKKYLPIIAIAVAIIIIVVILIAIFGGGPKKAVKRYISGFNKQNASKIIKSIDVAGALAWNDYDEDDFSKEDYSEFIDEYKEVDNDETEDETNDLIEYIDESFDEAKEEYKSYKFEIEKFKSVDKLGKDLYAVNLKINLVAEPKDEEEDEIDETDTATFIVYKNKIIYSDYFGF